MSELQIWPLQTSDIPIVIEWARLEDFAPGIGDISIYRNTDQQGIWVGWNGNTPVGCIAGVKYNEAYGFIGLYIVQNDFRGRGYGHQLWDVALEHLNGVACVGLEAAPSLIDTYEAYEFVAHSQTIRWQCFNHYSREQLAFNNEYSGLQVIVGTGLSMNAVHEYDSKREITARHHFLTQWLSHPEGEVITLMDRNGACHGFARIRPCLLPIGEGWRIGPILADTAELAQLLIESLLRDHSGVVLIDSPETNQKATALLAGMGFKKVSATTRMYRGDVMPKSNDSVFGLACLELG